MTTFLYPASSRLGPARVAPPLRDALCEAAIALLLLQSFATGCGARSGVLDTDDHALKKLPECEDDGETRPCQTVCGEGEQVCRGGKWQACNAEKPVPPVLDAVVRDFSQRHPDFEGMFPSGLTSGIVEDELDADGKPVYANALRDTATTNAYTFNQWYRTIPGVNVEFAVELGLVPSPDKPGSFIYRSSAFFPIDGLGFGNEGNPHNYHFTLEVSTAFRYAGGEVFKFTGDDDLWVFINRKLAIDLGGIHGSLSAEVSVDTLAKDFGLKRGEVYELHLFFAERHTIASNFNIETTIAEFALCE